MIDFADTVAPLWFEGVSLCNLGSVVLSILDEIFTGRLDATFHDFDGFFLLNTLYDEKNNALQSGDETWTDYLVCIGRAVEIHFLP